MSSEEIIKLFTMKGGEFVSPPSLFLEKLGRIKAFIFDWDGVFNTGIKVGESGSPFSETDAMGTNLLRYSWYLKNNQVPKTFIITGEENPAAQSLARREHFQAIYFKAKDKNKALQTIQDAYGLSGDEIAFFFDDVLDLNVARQVGLRLFLDSGSNPMMTSFVKANTLCDYIPFSSKPGAVRESAELLIGLNGNYDEVVENRMQFTNTYKNYLEERNSFEGQSFIWDNQEFVRA